MCSSLDFSCFRDTIVDNTVLSEDAFKCVQIIGIGAVILNGLSYISPEGNLTIYANWKEQDGYDSGIYRYIYIPEYNRDIGFSNREGIPTVERALCDLIKYPKLFSSELYSAMSWYLDETNDLSKLYETAKELCIPKSELQNVIDWSRDIDVY